MLHPLLLPLHFSFINTFLFFPLFCPTYIATDVEGYTACAPFTCCNFTELSYPFWSNNQPAYCGHPKFNLDCQNDKVTIDIMSQKFLVIDINQNTESLKIARLDLWSDPCPKEYTNMSLDFNFFSYTSIDDNITLLYDCDPFPYGPPENFNPFLNLSCPMNGDPRVAYLVANFANFSDLGCKFITVPVLVEALRSSIKDALGVGYVLDEGFEVGCSGVNRDQCDSCTQSRGRCGQNASTNEVICFCHNQQPYGGTCGKFPARPPLSAPIPSTTPPQALSSPNLPQYSAQSHGATSNHWTWQKKVIIAAVIAGLLTICCFICKLSRWQEKSWLPTKGNQDIEAFLKNHGALSLKRYKFSDVKKMTNSFKVKIGQGGFGAVYKGKLLNGSNVAVKILNTTKGNGKEFINEVASISTTSHVNVVTLLGFYLEGRKKVLIYEFMSNGSLDKFIYKTRHVNTPFLSWDDLYQIAIGIARGLEYLHRGCNTRILHLDIKPHNILLDENFCPKISDFGLAKLCPRKESIISMSDARGTIGYIAPEVWNRHFGGVSHKSDVYSYGMMLLEIVGGRKNINAEASHTSEIYFPDWIHRRLEQGTQSGLDDGEVVIEENEVIKKMTVVGLWCIQTIPNDRPTMSKVVDMLEGSMNSLEIPPRPVLSSPVRSVVESSTTLN